MKIREIKSRIRKECAFLNPVLLGICAGFAVLLGALFTTSLAGRVPGFFLPRTALPSFLHILFQLISYAILGAVFATLLKAPLCKRTLRLQKKSALLLCTCILVLCYVWIPLVCKASSYFLGALLCGVILTAVAVLFFLSYRISVISAGFLILFALWMLYILYITLSFLLFC
jgi:tryptophan-rich sensory protein